MGLLRKKQGRARQRPELQGKRDVSYTHYYGKESARADAVKKEENRIRSIRLPKTQARALPTYIAIIVIIASLFYASLLSSQVVILTGEGQGLQDKTYYQKKATELLHRSIFNSSKITFDSRSFTNSLTDQIPELASVNVHVPLTGRKLVVGLGFVRPAYIFGVNGGDYIVGENGVILAKYADVSAAKRLSLYKVDDKAPLNVHIGSTVLLESDILFIDTVARELTGKGYDIATMTLPQGAGELHVRFKNKPYFIKFALTGDARIQLGALESVTKSITSNPPQEYVDVRIGERVFVK